MYVTRPLSHYKTSPEALYLPPEGPNSGYLVIQDEESETYSCFGLCKNRYLAELPFPQNKILTTRYSSGSGENRHVSYNEVVFIPVLNQPLSSNRYYALKPNGSHKGEAFTCSKEEDMAQCCFCNCVRDVKPRPLDTHDIYQQFEIVQKGTQCSGDGSFYAKSLADDGYPPYFLRRKGWQIYSKTPKNYELHEAKGIDDSLRSRLPDLNFPPSTKTSNPVVVGKWYCPFVFIKEGRLSDMVKKSIFYELTLEQKWERVFEHENKQNNEGDVVYVDVALRSEAVFIGESRVEATWDERNVVDGAIWFTCLGGDNGREESVGLNVEIVERMRWEEEKVGWVDGGEKRTNRVKRNEKFEGIGGWKRFGCYILIERFVVKRMDGSLVLTYEFGHTHQIKSIFE
ncbi:hypothetical protein HanRHA438_Chr15g0699651 [Helianthus annuus]|uniref:Uncharacterized protein n=1 Tax=Helianthus annuus TaxID=4232 RepID=A0A251S882_HELAN|nr:uncharacterized protein LOC110911318 [Helianthus annuus]KAF5764039.1 hypothetical protein HanXRQr2_Chr15g0687391 [Helianthus annuus]KAJ0450784.1 hypothetical protein HanHA300_Chr15g0560131 [Helianthus annuus]KAJ0455061.1 hypothetical protein HanIR_Chr15g0746951 [Helianthus annuus]KAJ0472630.1 hypothetical protein HanHA89_Chr15g0609211 [Helianthus annuus]KAJ0648233.1 hypothetical protein HanLR1_Chr15g0570591 [Helianthus annuus]